MEAWTDFSGQLAAETSLELARVACHRLVADVQHRAVQRLVIRDDACFPLRLAPRRSHRRHRHRHPRCQCTLRCLRGRQVFELVVNKHLRKAQEVTYAANLELDQVRTRRRGATGGSLTA